MLTPGAEFPIPKALLPRKLLLNCPGMPVADGLSALENAPPVGAALSPPGPPAGDPGDMENIVDLKGFATPAMPVAWGRIPVPTVLPAPPALNPVPKAAPLPSDPVGLCLEASGVVGADWGMGGRDSRRAAPKEDEGLNALMPLKPVV